MNANEINTTHIRWNSLRNYQYNCMFRREKKIVQKVCIIRSFTCAIQASARMQRTHFKCEIISTCVLTVHHTLKSERSKTKWINSQGKFLKVTVQILLSHIFFVYALNIFFSSFAHRSLQFIDRVQWPKTLSAKKRIIFSYLLWHWYSRLVH